MEKRGILDEDVASVIKNGEITHKEKNHRFGLKKQSELEMHISNLVVIWFWNESGEQEVVTVYWRRRRK